MTNKTVLITGATSGIGEALFYHYASLGYEVIACGRNQEKLDKLASFKSNSRCLAFDITSEEQVKKAAKQTKNIDLLLLNAGDCQYIDDVMHFDSKLFSNVINTNLVSMGIMLEHFLAKVTKGGRVAFVSSSASILPFTRAQAYGASKAGVDYLANSLRLDLIKEQISVSLIHPGFIKTPLTDKNDFDMPFLLTAEQAAERIYNGIAAEQDYIQFPKRLTFLLKTFAMLPNFIWRSIALRSMQ